MLSFHHLRQKVAVLVQVFSDVFRCFHVFSKIVRDKLCLNLSTTVDVLSWQGLPRLRCQLQWGKPFCPTCWFRNLYDVVLKYERRDFSAFSHFGGLRLFTDVWMTPRFGGRQVWIYSMLMVSWGIFVNWWLSWGSLPHAKFITRRISAEISRTIGISWPYIVTSLHYWLFVPKSSLLHII